jgi:hypothetical protein
MAGVVRHVMWKKSTVVLGKWPNINIGIGVMVKKGPPNEMGSPPLGLSIMSSHVGPTSSMAGCLWLKQWNLFTPIHAIFVCRVEIGGMQKSKVKSRKFPLF